jgi:hypothetical protein
MKKAKTFYSIGSVLLILMGTGHFYGQFGPRGMDIQRSLIEQAMKEYPIRDFGFQYNLMDVMQCWGVFFGVLMILLGIQNVLIVRSIDRAAAMTRFSIFNTLGAAVLFAAGAAYVPFTAAGFLLILLCFGFSAVFTLRNP